MNNYHLGKLLLASLLVAFLLAALSWTRAGAQEPTYVGSATCARCHAAKYALFMETWHPNMVREANDEVRTQFGIILGDLGSSDPDLSFGRDDIAYVVGGQYKQRYLTEIDGELYVLPAEWNIVQKDWVPYFPESWRQRPYKKLCAGCHTTGYDPATEEWTELGVRCEACHGPGSQHVDSTGNRAYIVNPARLDFQSQAEVCGQCHSRGTDPTGTYPYPVGFRPGGPAKLSEVFVPTTSPDDFWPDGSGKRHHMQYLDWQKGEHAEAVNCVFCHVSHSLGETDHQTRMVGNHRCVICHETKKDLGAHIPFMKDAPVFCTDCHMPQISRLVPTDFQILSHTFWPPDPTKSIRFGGQEVMPNACNICHTDQAPEWAALVLGHDTTGLTVETPVPASQPAEAPVATPVSREPARVENSEGASESTAQSMLPVVGGAVIVTFVIVAGAVWLWRRR